MIRSESSTQADRRAWQALGVWGVFIVSTAILNGTLPFVLGLDLRAWTYSTTKDLLAHIVIYAGLFLIAPLVLVKGWLTVRRPSFLGPLLLAVVAILLRPFARPTAALVVAVLAYLHWRFDLSDLGIRSRGWKGDLAAALLLALMYLVPVLLRPAPYTLNFVPAVLAGLDRLFANPASTVENLFYFGFLTERLAPGLGRWLTPPLVGLMYTAHEMSNPEYWYEGVSFVLVFLGVAVTAAIYLWRRSAVVVWLGDGLGKMVGGLF